MFPGPTEVRLIGYSIESIWTQKIQIKYIDTKNELADMLTKGNFTRDEWNNNLLCLFNISHFSSTVCPEVMSKRTQKDSGEERVTAKSRPMMSLIARAPSTLSQSKHGTVRLNGFSKHVISKICVGSTGRDGIRVEKFPQVHYIENSRRDSKDDDKVKSVNQSNSKEGSSSCQCTMMLIRKTRKKRKLYCECSQRYRVCSKIHARTLVVLGAWIGEDMVRNSCQQA